MSQQVNLYQPIFRAQPKVFSAATILLASALLLLGLALLYGYARWQDAKLNGELVKQQARQDALLKRIEEFTTKYPPRQKNPALEVQIASLTAERAGKARALEILSGGALGNTKGFSGYLESLARQHVEGLWLTGMSISEGGAQLGLTGSTVEAQLLPRYLQQLSAEQAFTGREFKTFQLARGMAADVAQFDFNLHSGAQDASPQ